MCGVYGMVSLDGRPLAHPDRLERMAASLRHRGPDDRRLRKAADAALGAERLRVTDLRPEGAQPFADPAGALWLACNGALYDADTRRAQYADYPYRSRSDVEPLVPLLVDRGPSALGTLDGMFAIAVWETRHRRLTLARDRAGEKPLFYLQRDGEVWFASEIQALLLHPGLQRTLDRDAVVDLLRFGYVREPRSVFESVRSVEAGTILTFSDAGTQLERYWRPWEIAPTPGLRHREAEERLAALLTRAVARQARADVPVGVLLSGGLDSAVLAALAARPGAPPPTAFTVGFSDPSYDERTPAARVAAELGLRMVAVPTRDADLLAALAEVTERVAQPMADPAVLPTLLVAREARRHVGVVLGGEGADELFGGYPTYLGHRLASWLGRLPAGARRALRALADALPTTHEKVPVEFLLKRLMAEAHLPAAERHLAWFGTGLERALRTEATGWGDAAPEVGGDAVRHVMTLDYCTYLRNGLLPKVDRATMLVSLEARAPYLDRDVSAFALGVPGRLAVRGLTAKWLLKRVARGWLSASVVHRRKRGLSVPVARWLNGPLRADVDRLLAPDRVAPLGVLEPARVGALLSDHRAGRANHARALWPLVVLQLWRERWLGGNA